MTPDAHQCQNHASCVNRHRHCANDGLHQQEPGPAAYWLLPTPRRTRIFRHDRP